MRGGPFLHSDRFGGRTFAAWEAAFVMEIRAFAELYAPFVEIILTGCGAGLFLPANKVRSGNNHSKKILI